MQGKFLALTYFSSSLIGNSNSQPLDMYNEPGMAHCKTRLRGYKTLFILNQLLIKTKIPTNKEVSCFESLICCIYHSNKC